MRIWICDDNNEAIGSLSEIIEEIGPHVRGYIKAPILGVKLINTWLFQLNALGAFSLTNLVFSSIT